MTISPMDYGTTVHGSRLYRVLSVGTCWCRDGAIQTLEIVEIGHPENHVPNYPAHAFVVHGRFG